MAPKLKPSYAKLEDVPEALREFYTEDGGAFVLDVDVRTDPRTQGLHSALEKEKEQRRKLAEQLAKFDPERIAALEREHEEIETRKAAAVGDFDKLKAQMVAKHQAELDALAGKVTKLSSFATRMLGENAARQALENAGGIPDLLLPHALKAIKVVENGDGEFVAQVVDEKGTPRIATAKGDPFTIQMLVEEMAAKDVYAPGFRGTGSAGSGGRASAPTTTGNGRVLRISRTDAADAATYQRLRAEAAKQGMEVEIEPLPAMR